MLAPRYQILEYRRQTVGAAVPIAAGVAEGETWARWYMSRKGRSREARVAGTPRLLRPLAWGVEETSWQAHHQLVAAA